MTFPGQFTGLLIQTCVVYRRQQVSGADKKDRFGQPTRDEKEHHRHPTRCTAARGGRAFGERMQDVVQTTHELFLDVDADVVEDDVITVLAAPIDAATDADTGPAVVRRAIVKLVRPVMDGEGLHHYEVELSTQRPATSASEPELS